MSISFDRALGVPEQAMTLRAKRAELLANNLANADTPGFKARDVDFKAVMQSQGQNMMAASQTHPAHIPLGETAGSLQEPTLLYRNPSQPSVDGNTVDTQLEIAEYTRNAVEFEASFQILNSKFRGLTSALKGE